MAFVHLEVHSQFTLPGGTASVSQLAERASADGMSHLALTDTRLERKLMDYEARARGLDNWVSAQGCIQLFRVRDNLSTAERAWIDPMLLACVDGGLWLRNVPRDTVSLYHKTGSVEGVLHDWGYTEQADLFLLTRNVRDESEVCRALDVLGPILLT